MTATHPDFQRALDANDMGALIGIALRARGWADDGLFCECEEPRIEGLDLMCGACLLNNKDQERRRIVNFVRAHAFEPDDRTGWMCKRCIQPEEHGRHHGVDGIGRCTWGEELHPPYEGIS